MMHDARFMKVFTSIQYRSTELTTKARIGYRLSCLFLFVLICVNSWLMFTESVRFIVFVYLSTINPNQRSEHSIRHQPYYQVSKSWRYSIGQKQHCGLKWYDNPIL